jgi:hypothetical protein
MAESSLSLTYDQIYAKIGDYLQGDTTVPNADSAIDARIDDCIQSGLRTFYAAHDWSFLQIVATLSVSSATTALPDDFARLCDDPSYPSSGGSSSVPPTTLSRVKRISDDELRKLLSANSTTGAPLYCSVRSHGVVTTGERFDLCVYPSPSGSKTFTYCYITLPNKLSSGSNYPLGGSMHAETILQAALAIAEQRWDDDDSMSHQKRYEAMLAQSIALDKAAEAAKSGAFPFDTLSQGKPISYRQYLMRVGHQLGFYWDPGTWTHDQYNAADIAVQSGYRRFCYPPAMQEGAEPHGWSFLKPTGTISITQGTTAYDLPSDFGALLGDPTYPAAATNTDGTPTRVTRMAIITDLQLRAALGANTVQAPPQYCAVRPTLSDSSAKQAWKLDVYPTPSASFTITFQYQTMPPALSISNPYPVGSEIHGETILEAMLAAAEAQTAVEPAEDIPTASLSGKPVKAQPQLHHGLFLELLRQSIRIDEQNQATTADSPWPVYPASHGIGLSYRELLSQAGSFLEYGWDPSTYTREQFAFVDGIVQEGYRKFLYPKPIDPKYPGNVYEWTFLSPETTITTVADTADYAMPIYFSHMLGQLSFVTPTVGYCALQEISLPALRRLQGDVITSGLPAYYCITPIAGASTESGISWGMKDQETAQSYNVTLFPTPDAVYELTGRIKAVPPRLSDTNPWPMCGPEHAETLRTAVLMAAEIRHIQIKPPVPFGRGRRVWIPRPSQEEFNERLAASIGLDAKRRPEWLGNSVSSGYRYGSNWHNPNAAEVTYEGHQF